MNWYIAVLKKYFVFTGRARRAEYWYFLLFNFIISAVLFGVFTATAGDDVNAENGAVSVMGMVMIFLIGAYTLAVLAPSIGVMVRRLHDTDRSGWWILIQLVPAIGGIVFLIFMLLDGTPGDNRFGPDPKKE